MTKPKCSFSESLFLLQSNPDTLEEAEWKALQEHLVNDPPCALCHAEMDQNKAFLDAVERAFQARREKKREEVKT